MGKKQNYSDYLNRAAVSNNVPLPDKIKCIRCDKVKPPASYAAVRQNDLKAKMAQNPGFNATTTAYIPCAMCTGGQVTELHCHMCDKWMGLTKFAKTQRRNPDRAKCLKCIQEQIAMGNADDSDSDDGSDGGDDSDGSEDSHAFTFDDTASVTESLASTTLSASDDTFNTGSRGMGNGGGVKLGSATQGGTIWGGNSTTASLAASNSLASGPRPSAWATAAKIPPHMRQRMSSAASESGESTVSDATNTTTTTTAPARRGLPTGFNPSAYSSPAPRKAASSMAGSCVNDGRKFAKIPAAKPKKTAREIEDDDDDVRVSDDDEDDEPFSG